MQYSSDARPPKTRGKVGEWSSVAKSKARLDRFSETPRASEWLQRFPDGDAIIAAQMIDAMTLVSGDEFSGRMRDLVLRRAALADGPIGLYAEREVPPPKGPPNRLFDQAAKRPLRARGPGPPPIAPVAGGVGSEGIVATLITSLCRADKQKFFNHPGPDAIRSNRIRRFMLLTDLIGSGRQACRYIEAAWSVASVRSWNSFGWLGTEVIAYSATEPGMTLVRSHASAPKVSIVASCPTVFNAFDEATRVRVEELCIRYDPGGARSSDAFGYDSIGALIAFAHGCPNNAPRLLHGTNRLGWIPLFPNRVTSASAEAFGDRRPLASLRERLRRMGQPVLARSALLDASHTDGRAVVAVLAASCRGPRTLEAVAGRSGLTLPEVEAIRAAAIDWGWMKDGRLTDVGQRQLAAARKVRSPKVPLPIAGDTPYFPTQLREPREI